MKTSMIVFLELFLHITNNTMKVIKKSDAGARLRPTESGPRFLILNIFKSSTGHGVIAGSVGYTLKIH